ncbi:conserved exported hypothetical protein [Candidatus Sulfopaludibacter sp. SbA3]|nr:conserved exported hypothetical protein [Candidatus Sulfopaludibacter sp. SbA3]
MKQFTVWVLAAAATAGAADGPPAASVLQDANLRQLRTVHRVFVDRLTGGETAAQMRDILISSLAGADMFILTENQERADCILRGASEDLVFTEVHQSSDGINAHANLGTGTRSSGYGSGSSSRNNSAGIGVGENESDHSAERRHEAIAAVRLVNKDGDVIWSTTQESLGAKFHGASADVAEKITARLKEDFEKARKLP